MTKCFTCSHCGYETYCDDKEISCKDFFDHIKKCKRYQILKSDFLAYYKFCEFTKKDNFELWLFDLEDKLTFHFLENNNNNYIEINYGKPIEKFENEVVKMKLIDLLFENNKIVIYVKYTCSELFEKITIENRIRYNFIKKFT